MLSNNNGTPGFGSDLTCVPVCPRWSTGGIMKTARAGPSGLWYLAPRTTPGWRVWRPTPTTLSKFGATTLQDTGHPASTSRSTPRKPVRCASKQFSTYQQGPASKMWISMLCIVSFHKKCVILIEVLFMTVNVSFTSSKSSPQNNWS